MSLRERKTAKKREEIIKAATKIVSEKGYHGTTMEEIAATLLMTKGSVYYYFENKEDLMYQCHNLVLLQATEDLELHLKEDTSAEEILRRMIVTHIDYAIEENETFNLIIKPGQTFNEKQLTEVLKYRRYYAGLFDQVLQKGIETNEFEIDELVIARMMILGSMNWIQQWYNPNGRMSKEELQEVFSNHIIKLLK